MKIRQIYSDGKTCPFLVCELCNKNIRHKENNKFESEGMVFWKDVDKENNIETIIAHKKCMLKLEEIKNDKYVYPNSAELNFWFFDLLNNSQIKPKLFPFEF